MDDNLDDILNSPSLPRKQKQKPEIIATEISATTEEEHQEVTFSDDDADQLLQTPRSGEISAKPISPKQQLNKLLIDDEDEFQTKSPPPSASKSRHEAFFDSKDELLLDSDNVAQKPKPSDAKRVAFTGGDAKGEEAFGNSRRKASPRSPTKSKDDFFGESKGRARGRGKFRRDEDFGFSSAAAAVSSSLESENDGISGGGAYQPWRGGATGSSDNLLAGIDLTPKRKQTKEEKEEKKEEEEQVEKEVEEEQQQAAASEIELAARSDTAEIDFDAESAATARRRPGSGRRERRNESAQLSQIFGSESQPIASLATHGPSPEMLQQLQQEVRRLRLEQQHEQQLQQLQQKKSQEQLQLVIQQHEQQVMAIEESFRRREIRLQQEITTLESQLHDEQQQQQKQQTRQRLEQQQQQEAVQRQQQQLLDSLQQQQRTELEAIRSAAPHAGALSNLIDQLGHVAEKLLANGEVLREWRLREEAARAGGEGERRVMQELLQSLTSQSHESKRTEKWLQEFGSQLMEERRAVAAQRAELHSLQQQLQQQQQAAGSGGFSDRAALAEEKQLLAELEAALRRTRSDLMRQKSDTEALNEELQLREQRLNDRQKLLEQRAAAITEQEQQQQQLQASLTAQQQRLEEEQRRSGASLAQLQSLRQKEREVAAARVQLAQQQEQLQHRANSLVCASCCQPMREANVKEAALMASVRMSEESARIFGAREWDEVEEEKLYLQSLDLTPYASAH